MVEAKKPNVNSAGQKELDQAAKQLESFEKEVKDLTLDRMSAAPKEESEQQTKLSSREIEKANDVYLKASRTIASREKFNERYRDDWNHSKEYVKFIAENKEIIGEHVEMWTKPFPGVPAEFWEVPTNKPVWGPRYLAEQIKRCSYHRLSMSEKMSADNLVGSHGMGSIYGKIVVDASVQRLDAIPVNDKKKSIFLGASGF